MKRTRYRSLPIWSKSINVDKSTGDTVISGVVIVQEGTDKYGDIMDRDFLDGIVSQGNGAPQGIKSRFGHPNMCSTTLGTYLGRYKNFSIVEDDADGKAKVVADLHLDETAKNTPNGNLFDYVVNMAEKNPDMFGNSIVFSGSYKPELDEKGKPKQDADGWTYYTNVLLLETFMASDLVDSPAATDNLFKEKSVEDLGTKLTDFLDENPEVFELVKEQPKLLEQFMARYKSYINQKSNTMSKKTTQAKADEQKVSAARKLMKELGALLGFAKSIELTTADGKTLVVDTEADAPAVGDPVTMDGKPAENGDYKLNDGRTIVVADGKISEIKPAEEAAAADDEAAAEEAQKELVQLRDKVTNLEKENGQLKAQVAAKEKELNAAKEKFKQLEPVLKELNMGSEPEKEDTTFNHGQTKVKDTDANSKALQRIEEERKKKETETKK